MKRRAALSGAWLGVACLVLLGCRPPDSDPGAVVERYFATLARDPIRNLALLTDDFHVHHGLTPVTTAAGEKVLAGDPEPLLGATTPSVASGQIAWLRFQMKPEFRAIAPGLRVLREQVMDPDGDSPRVLAVVKAVGSPAFELEFRLARTPSGLLIDEIAPRRVPDRAFVPAFVAYPNSSAQRAQAERARAESRN